MKYWQISHALCIVAHLGMAIAGFVTFILAGPLGNRNGFRSGYSSSSPFRSSSSNRPTIEGVILPWATFGVAALSLSSNTLAFVALILIEHKRHSRYAQRSMTLQKGLTILTYVGNYCLGIADAVLLGFLASRLYRYSILAAPMALSAVAAVFAFVTATLYIFHHRTLNQRQREQSVDGAQQTYNNQPPYNNQSSWGYQQHYNGQPMNSSQQGYNNYTSWQHQQTYATQPTHENQTGYNNQPYQENSTLK